MRQLSKCVFAAFGVFGGLYRLYVLVSPMSVFVVEGHGVHSRQYVGDAQRVGDVVFVYRVQCMVYDHVLVGTCAAVFGLRPKASHI